MVNGLLTMKMELFRKKKTTKMENKMGGKNIFITKMDR